MSNRDWFSSNVYGSGPGQEDILHDIEHGANITAVSKEDYNALRVPFTNPDKVAIKHCFFIHRGVDKRYPIQDAEGNSIRCVICFGPDLSGREWFIMHFHGRDHMYEKVYGRRKPYNWGTSMFCIHNDEQSFLKFKTLFRV